MSRALIASDGNEFLLVWSPDQDPSIYATPLDRFGAARGAAQGLITGLENASGNTGAHALLWADTRYLLLLFDVGTRELQVIELDREGNLIGRWDPVALPSTFSNALRQAFWIDAALQLVILTPDRHLGLVEVTTDGHLRMVGDFFDHFGPAERAVPGHGGWYTFHPRQLMVSFWSDQLEQHWTRPLMPVPPGVVENQANNVLTLLAPLANGSLVVGWTSSARNSSIPWHRLAVVSSDGVVLGEPTSIQCSGGWSVPLPASGSDATYLFNLCGNTTITTIDTRTAKIVESIPLTGPGPVTGLAVGSAGPLVLSLSYENRSRLSAFLLGSFSPIVHHPARLAAEIAALSVASSLGRTTAAWIETDATGNRILVRRTGVSQPGPTLMSLPVSPRATTVTVASSPTTDLVVWTDGDEVKVQRFDPTGYPIDVPFTIGTPGWRGRAAIAWNGFSFLVVWESMTTGGGTTTKPLFQAAVVPETGPPIALGFLPLERPVDWRRGFGSEAPSLAWNGREFLLTFLGFAEGGGCIILCPPSPRSLFAVRLDSDGRPLGDLVRIEDAEMPPFPDVKGTPASSVASDGGEFLITHGSVAAAQLIRVETRRGMIEVESVEEIFPWDVTPGLVTIESGEEGSGYAIAIRSPSASGEWLFLDRLDTSGLHLGRRAHAITGGGAMDVALAAGTPLAAFRAVHDGRRAAFVATPTGSVAPPPVPAAPEAWVRREPGASNYVVEWTPVDGATGYIVTRHFEPFPDSPYELQSYILRRWIGADETQFRFKAGPGDRFAVQAIGPHGSSEIVDAVRAPADRRRIVAR